MSARPDTMKAKHTPGPWSADRWTAYAGDYNIESPTAGMIASVTGRGGEFAAEDAANASLIASAPALLAALEAQEEADAAWHAYDSYGFDGGKYVQEFRDELEFTAREAEDKAKALRTAALAQARGEKPDSREWQDVTD